MTTIKILLQGFPGHTSRGWLGWSTVVLIRHGDHTILFDTGAYNDRPALIEALGRENLSPALIDTIILSHLHFDHVANVELFSSAQIIVHQAGLRYAQQQAERDLALSSWLTTALLASPKLTIIEAEPELWPGLQIIQTPGHTSGCISVVLTINHETWLLAADAVKTRAELQIGQAEVGFDLIASQESISRIRKLADWVVPGHDVPLRVIGETVEPDGTALFDVTATLPGDEAVARLEL